jgi:hypothetical protein
MLNTGLYSAKRLDRMKTANIFYTCMITAFISPFTLLPAQNARFATWAERQKCPGVDINATDDSGRTALHQAMDPVVDGTGELTKTLIEHNADTNAEDNFGFTALEVFALGCKSYYGRIGLLESKLNLLLTADIKVDHRIQSGAYRGRGAYDLAFAQRVYPPCQAFVKALAEHGQKLTRLEE